MGESDVSILPNTSEFHINRFPVLQRVNNGFRHYVQIMRMNMTPEKVEGWLHCSRFIAKKSVEFIRPIGFTGLEILLPIADLGDLLGFLETGRAYELVIGTRVIDQGRMPLLRKIVNRTTSLVISLLGHENVPDVQSGYRMIDLRIFKKIRLRTNNFQTEAELVCKAARSGYRIGFTPITAVYDDERSYIKPMIDMIRFINMALRFLWR